MTKTLIEQLNELASTATWISESGDGDYVKLTDLRAIIEQYKTEGAEPVAWLRFRAVQYSPSPDFGPECNEWLEPCKKDDIGDDGSKAFPVYSHPSPAIVGELVKALGAYYDRLYEHKDIATAAHEMQKILIDLKEKV
jgi:hypothetical protein